MIKFYFSILIFSLSISVYAQKTQWQKDIKSSTQDFLNSLSITIDGQYLISGSSIKPPQPTSISSGGNFQANNGYDFHVVKLNQQGDQVWEKYFSGNKHDFMCAATPTQEGGFLLAGTSFSGIGQDKKEESLGGSDIWLVKTDENGTEEWQKTIGTPYDEEAISSVQTTDLGYFVVGNVSNSKSGFGSKDVLLIKLDKWGRMQKQLILGGKGLDEVQKIIPTKDGGCLIGIYSRSSNSVFSKTLPFTTESTSVKSNKLHPQDQYSTKNPEDEKPTETAITNNGEGDYLIVKIDMSGKIQWQKDFGGSEDDHLKTLNNSDFGYLIGGESRSKTSGNKTTNLEEGTDLWMIALRENGEEIWQKSYNFGNKDIIMSANTISDMNGRVTKGFIIGGYTQAEGEVKKDEETFWMLYVDKDGNESWHKHIKGKSKQKEERLVDVKLNNDGSYILAGTSAEELGQENWKIVKLGDKDVEDLIARQDIKIYPNPVNEYCYVEIGFGFKEADLSIFDMSGRLVQSIMTKNLVTKLNTSGLPQGIYLITAKTENNMVSAKIIKK